MDLFTDCRSLEESVNQAGLGSVNDKRLAIDLTGIRQQVWRQKKEETGDPLLTDRIPEDGTTRLFWVNTEKMAADSLAKSMKPKSLEGVMFGCTVDLTPEKITRVKLTFDMPWCSNQPFLYPPTWWLKHCIRAVSKQVSISKSCEFGFTYWLSVSYLEDWTLGISWNLTMELWNKLSKPQ